MYQNIDIKTSNSLHGLYQQLKNLQYIQREGGFLILLMLQKHDEATYAAL